MGDLAFLHHLATLKRLRDFVIEENVRDPDDNSPDVKLRGLNSLFYLEGGRRCSDDEWDEVSQKLQTLYSYLTQEQNRRFKFSLAAPSLRILPVVLVVLAVAFFTLPALIKYEEMILLSFVGWTVTLGGLGSMAFILVNALGIEVDATIDVTNSDLTRFRVLLGTLFSVVLTLPFVFRYYASFVDELFNATASVDVQQALMLLLPFLFGFSTSLVLTILNRMMESVQTFFGVSAKASAKTPAKGRRTGE